MNKTDLRILRSLGFSKVYLIKGEGFTSRIPRIVERSFSGDKIELLYVGRWLKSKGVERLVNEFMKLAPRERMGLSLRLVGDSDFESSDSVDRNWLAELVDSSDGTLSTHPFTSNIAQFVSGRTVFVSLSSREGMPFSVLEMLDAGVPCLLSAVPGHLDLKRISRVKLCRLREPLAECLNVSELAALFEEPIPDVSSFQIKSVIAELIEIFQNDQRIFKDA